MARKSDTLRQGEPSLAPIVGAQVTVSAQDGSLLSLTTDDGKPLSNPVITDQFGSYYFNIGAPAFVDLRTYFGGRLVREDFGVPVGITPTTIDQAAASASASAAAAVQAALNADVVLSQSAASTATTQATNAAASATAAASNASPAASSVDISLDAGRNLFDVDVSLNGQFVNASGALVANASFAASGFIPVAPSSQFISNKIIFGSAGPAIAYYTSTGTFVSSDATGDRAAGTAITVPATASIASVRITVAPADRSALIVNRGTVVAPFKPFGSKASRPIAIAAMFDSLPIYTNLFDPNRLTIDTLVSATTGIPASVAGYFATNFMPCQPGGKVITNLPGASSPYGIAFYALNQDFISGITTTTANTPYDVPATAYYWRTSYPSLSTTALGNGEQNNISWSTAGRLYCGLGTTLPPRTYAGTPQNDIAKIKRFRGLKVASLGDSITRQGTWQAALGNYIDTPIINWGIDGSRAFDFLTNAAVAAGASHTVGANGYGLTASSFADVDLCIIEIGANDWGPQTAIGTINDVPPTFAGGFPTGGTPPAGLNSSTTFMAALRWNIRTILACRADGRMRMMLWGPGHQTNMTITAGRPITLRNYGAAVRDLCAEEGVAWWDSYQESGIGPSNYVITTTDTQPAGSTMADHVHASQFGGREFLGPGIGKFIERTF
jgi:hypothetical protein